MRVSNGRTLTTPPPIVAPPRTTATVTPPPRQHGSITRCSDSSIHARATDSGLDSEKDAYQADWIGISFGSAIGMSLLLGLVCFIGWGPITDSSTAREAVSEGHASGDDRESTFIPSRQISVAKLVAASDAREDSSEEDSEEPGLSAVVSVPNGMISEPSTTTPTDLPVEDQDIASAVKDVTADLVTETQSPTEFWVSADVTVADVSPLDGVAFDGVAEPVLEVKREGPEVTTTRVGTNDAVDHVMHAEPSQASEVQQPVVGLADRDQEPLPLASLTSFQPTPTFPPPPTCVDGQCPSSQGPETQSHGTALEWVESPELAYLQAQEEDKLVFLIHISGNFEIPGFT